MKEQLLRIWYTFIVLLMLPPLLLVVILCVLANGEYSRCLYTEGMSLKEAVDTLEDLAKGKL